MISPLLLNHVFVIVHGVLWSSTGRPAHVPVPLMLLSVWVSRPLMSGQLVDLGTSLHVSYTSYYVDALIKG